MQSKIPTQCEVEHWLEKSPDWRKVRENCWVYIPMGLSIFTNFTHELLCFLSVQYNKPVDFFSVKLSSEDE